MVTVYKEKEVISPVYDGTVTPKASGFHTHQGTIAISSTPH